jgi:hypothetical protein
MAAIGTAVNLLDLSTRMDPEGGSRADRRVAVADQCVQQEHGLEGRQPHDRRARDDPHRSADHLLPQAQSRHSAVQVDDRAGRRRHLHDGGRGQIDKDLADLNGLTSQFRMSENQPFIESMGQTFAAKAFYGNTGLDPEQFTGLATRYSDDSGPANAENIINGGGTGTDNTSIWIIDHSESGVYGIYPKGCRAGLHARRPRPRRCLRRADTAGALPRLHGPLAVEVRPRRQGLAQAPFASRTSMCRT